MVGVVIVIGVIGGIGIGDGCRVGECGGGSNRGCSWFEKSGPTRLDWLLHLWWFRLNWLLLLLLLDLLNNTTTGLFTNLIVVQSPIHIALHWVGAVKWVIDTIILQH